jgi:hypothetical protein
VSLGIQLTLTNIGGIVSGQIYQTSSAPEFKLGHAWSLGCLAFAWCMWWVIRWVYLRREKGKEAKRIEGWEEWEEEEEFTDRSVGFRYQL